MSAIHATALGATILAATVATNAQLCNLIAAWGGAS